MLKSVFSFGEWGVSLTRPVLGSLSVVRRVGSFSYTPRAGICQVGRRVRINFSICLVVECAESFVGREVSLTRPVLESVSSFGGMIVSLTRPVLESVRSFGT